MIVAIHQPNYLPWIGFYHKMLSSDIFVILDDVVCSNKAERRNLIKGSTGIINLSVPLLNKKALIKDVEVNNQINWKQQHFVSLQSCYARTDYWKTYSPLFYEIYQKVDPKLVDLNLMFTHLFRNYLDIQTPILNSSELSGISGAKNTKIINICKALGAEVFLSGTGAKSYIDEEAFRKNNLKVVYQKFEHPIYPQVWGEFKPNLSVVDLLFNCGPNAKQYITKQIITL